MLQPSPPIPRVHVPSHAGVPFPIVWQDGYLQFHSVLRGGQLLSKVHPGDILLAIDHVPCRDYSVSDIQRLIVGPEGSQVSSKGEEKGSMHGSPREGLSGPVWSHRDSSLARLSHA